MYDHYFSNFGRSPVPDDLCKDSATRHPRFWRRRFLKVFIIYGHSGHLGQWTPTILAIFHFPAPGRLQMRSLQRRSHLKFSTFFPIQIHREVNSTSLKKKVKCQCTTIILAFSVDLPSLTVYKFSHKASLILEKKIFKVFTIYGHGGHLGQWTATILTIFHSPAPARLQMKFEQHWPRGSRGEVV